MKTATILWVRRATASFAALISAGLPHLAHANPVGGKVTQGGATFSSQGPQFTITTSGNSAINWQSFNIGLGQTTTFVEPSSSSVVWNQISGPATQILGTINANGYVVLQNQSGFYVGGQAAINAPGLVMTTSSTPVPDLSSSGAWQFNAPPPTANIINYGQINISGGGTAFLIASDIENHGTISAPQGNIGLYAGQQVLVSERPDGRGLSAKVTLPQGSVDNTGRLIADAGTIAMQAQVVNQGGLIQANSIREVNGMIELVASDAVNLGANSVLSAQGDSSGASPGGTVTIKSGNTFSDLPGSTINVSGGAQGGNGGQVEISAATLGSIQSTIAAKAAGGFLGGTLTLDPYDLTVDSSFVSSLTPTLNSGLFQINLEADHNIELSTIWNLIDPGSAAKLTLTAGNNITFDDGSAIVAGNHWSVSLSAGLQYLTARPASGTGGIYLNGSSFIQTQNGDINLWAAGDVIVNPGPAYPTLDPAGLDPGNNGIRTLAGGNISVTALFGNVNTGGNINGYTFNTTTTTTSPYYTVSTTSTAPLGGISTAAGGNVTITAGGNVASYLPVENNYINAQYDAGSGAFGPEPGNVTVTAGGNVSGHYVLANGTGTITAGGNIGATTASGGFALSLVKGSWDVFAPNGSIYVQDVRNPNGVFNDGGGQVTGYPSFHAFDYDPFASLTLNAGNEVEITGAGAPHSASGAFGTPVPMLFPPTLRVSTGSGGFALNANIILFPSTEGELNVTTTQGGNLYGMPASTGHYYLNMSDSGATQWNPEAGKGGPGSFDPPDKAAQPTELNNPNPVVMSISGSMENLNLRVTKGAEITVGGDMVNAGFVGENLPLTPVTSIKVAGKISYSPLYTFTPVTQSIVSAEPFLPSQWDSIFSFLVNPAASLLVPNTELNDTPQQLTAFLLNPPSTLGYNLRLALNSGGLESSAATPGYAPGNNPGFVYDASTQQLGFQGKMTQAILSALDSPTITVFAFNSAGNVMTTTGADGKEYFATKQVSFASQSTILALYAQSQTSTPANGSANIQSGLQIGGPGQFDITAASMDLGNSPGIISWGIYGAPYAPYQSLAPWTPSGAAVNVNVAGDITLLTSTIASIYGGNVTVNSGGSIYLSQGNFSAFAGANICYGIFTSGHSDVNVLAENNIDIGGARIAAFDGGNISIASVHGNVDAGNGVNSLLIVPAIYQSANGSLDTSGHIDSPYPFGSGVVANSPGAGNRSPGDETLPGNITIHTPEGNITSTLGGIQQVALDGSVTAGPTITLTAGTPPPTKPGDPPEHVGNVDLGLGGVVGGTIDVTAQGNVQGLIVSRQNSDIQAAQSFTGTVLAGGLANVTASAGGVVGTIVGVGGANVSGGAGVTAEVLSQNVSIGGAAAQSTLGAAAPTSTSVAAAAQANASTQQQLAKDTTDNSQDNDLKKPRKALPTLVRRVSRVTVILPPKGKS